MKPSSRFLKLASNELRLGMFVAELDRPWLETPFLVQGFVIRSVEELEVLAQLCQYVYIDTGQSVRQHQTKTLNLTHVGSPRLPTKKLEEMFHSRITPYEDAEAFSAELARAGTHYSDYKQTVHRLFADIKDGGKINLGDIDGAMHEVIDSVIRHPDALLLLARLRRKGDYTYNHAIGCSIWAASMGRQLGLPKRVIHSLTLGGLLIDVGKVQISDQLINKPGKLTQEELELAKAHVDRGLAMLKKTKGVDVIALQMVAAHHERFNGNGYPKGLKNRDIPVYGRVAAIIDVYDALISDKPYRPGIAPSEAIKILYSARNVDFQGELVETFIQALGIYPAGSIVELTNGQVGIVVTEHRHRRLRPKLLIMLDENKERLSQSVYLDLFEVTQDATGQPLEILKSLNPGDYGVELDEILI